MKRQVAFTPHPAAELFRMLSQDELDVLVASIKTHGLEHPGVLHDGLLLDGRNRQLACELAGVPFRTVKYKGPTDEQSLVRYVIRCNRARRADSKGALALAAARLVEYYAERAKKRRGVRTDLSPDLGGSSAKACEEAAREIGGVSCAAVEYALRVLRKGVDELADPVETGDLAITVAADIATFDKAEQLDMLATTKPEALRAEVKKRQRAAKHAELAKGGAPLPSSKFRVIYADPPWQYNDTRVGLEGYSATAAEEHYPTMPTADICAMGVGELAEADAVLLMWATFPLLPDALEVVAAWGFTYKTAFVWSKGRANMGHYHTASAELLIVATRGSCTPDVDKREDQVQSVPRGAHSEKPEHFRAMIDRLYPHGRRIELFRRGDAPQGWAVWGNEAREAA